MSVCSRLDVVAASTAFAITTALLLASTVEAKEWISGIRWSEPPVVTPGAKPGQPPSDAIVLFSGKDLSAWEGGEKWEIKDDYAITRKGDIKTKQQFGDVQLHIEFATPPEVKGSGQGRGNSGVFFFERYEVQVLDSYNNDTYYDGQCGAIYKQSPPMVNACRGPGEWQTYDIIFTAPRRDEAGEVTTPAFITVLQNGVVVQNHFPIKGNTWWHQPPAYEKHGEKGSISLQFHGNDTRFRNIWARDLEPIKGITPGVDTPQPDEAARKLVPNMTLVAGNVYSGGAPQGEEAMKKLQEMGVTRIISLNEEAPDAELAKKYGIEYLQAPVTYEAMPAESLAKVMETVKSTDGGVLIHCNRGEGRGPATAAATCSALRLITPENVDKLLESVGFDKTDQEKAALYKAAKSGRSTN